MNKNKWLVFVLVAVAVFMSTLDSSIVNTALPIIMEDLDTQLSTIEWVVMIYLLTVSSLLLSCGRLSDIKGRRWVYCRGFIIFTIGSLCCSIASDPMWLIIARSIQGVGAAMLMACSPAIVVDTFPISERGRVMGMLGTVVAAGLTTGPILGGILIDFLSWRAIFYVNVPIGILSILLAVMILETEKPNRFNEERFDWLGAVIMIIFLCTFIIALSHAYHWGYTSIFTGVFLIVAIISAVVWVRIEFRKKHPIFEPSLIKIRLFIMPIISAIIIFACVFIVIFLMPFFLVHPVGLSIKQVGYIMSIPFVILFFISPVSGAISDKIGSRMLCTMGMVFFSIAFVLLSQLQADDPILSIAWRLSIVGLGIGIFVPPNSAAAMSAAPSNHRGIAAGTMATARNLGMVLGIAVGGLIFNTIFRDLSQGLTLKTYGSELEPFFMSAFKSTMLIGAGIAAIGAIITYLRGKE